MELREKMAEYEKNVGSVTPGAIGIEGGGRRQHSTNLNVEEPAVNAYANASTTTTPKQSKSNSKSNSTSKNSSLLTSGSTELHMHSFAGFNRFSDRFENICDRHFGSSSSNRTGSSEKERKRRHLLAAKKNHMETVTFLSTLPVPSRQTQKAYENALQDMIKTNEAMVKLDNDLARELEVEAEVEVEADEPVDEPVESVGSEEEHDD